MKLKHAKRIVSILCAACLVFAMAVPALAAAVPPGGGDSLMGDVYPTVSPAVTLGPNGRQTIRISIPAGYPYWKIAIRNESSTGCQFTLSRNGVSLFTSTCVDAYDSASFENSDAPLATGGSYTITIQSVDSGVPLKGTLWYKFATEAVDVMI